MSEYGGDGFAGEGVADALVSVIIPTYQRSTFLPRAIDSVLSQTFRRFILVVVDDNGPESGHRSATEAVMGQYIANPRIRYLRHERNRGGAAARNTGIHATETPYVAFLDDDDEWSASKLERQVERFERAPASVGLVYAGATVVDEVTGRTYHEMPTLRGKVFPVLLAHNAVGSTSTVLVRRDALHAVGGFDERLHASQDFDLYLKLARICEFDFVDEPLIIRNEHRGQRITKATDDKIAASELIYRKYADEFARNPRIRSQYRFKQARFHVLAGNRYRASELFLRALASNPRRVSLLGHAALAALGRRPYQAVRESTRPLRLPVRAWWKQLNR